MIADKAVGWDTGPRQGWASVRRQRGPEALRAHTSVRAALAQARALCEGHCLARDAPLRAGGSLGTQMEEFVQGAWPAGQARHVTL